MRRRKTTEEKRQIGTYRADRAKESPRFVEINPKVPTFLKDDPVARREWQRVLPLLAAEGVLKETDRAILASYCSLFSRWRAASEHVAKSGLTVTVSYQTKNGGYERLVPNPNTLVETRYFAAMLKAASKLGLSPIDRERVTVSPFDDSDTGNSNDTNLDDYSL